jgi:hypothetical protein
VSSPYGGPLVTDEMYVALRGFAYQGLQTPVSILRREVVENPYGDDSEVWAEESSTWGWIRQMNDPSIVAQNGVAQTTGVFRLELPVGTDVRPGDMVGVEGATYMVENTSVEDTVQVFLEVYIRATD